MVSTARVVWLRVRLGIARFSAPKFVKLTPGTPQFKGSSETPVMPRSAATLSVFEKGLVRKVRDRLKLNSTVFTICGAKVCDSLSVTFCWRTDVLLVKEGKLETLSV